jgi:hypothetical protein
LLVLMTRLVLNPHTAYSDVGGTFGYFSENLGLFRFVSVCYETVLVCFGCFDIGSKHRNKPKLFVIGFTKQTETNAKQILFRFVSVRTENYFCLFRGHPKSHSATTRGHVGGSS